MRRILLIDDDERLGELLGEYFLRFDLELATALRPSAGLALLAGQPFDLVILDIMLPEMDGFEVCRTIRRDSDIPIIMLTARGEVTDRVVGLEIGADDYLPKPFEPRELVARIQNIFKRMNAGQSGSLLHSGALQVDPARRRASLAGADLDLSTMEFDLLALLAAHPGRVFSRDDILAGLKGMEADVFSRSVDILVSRLRQKLGDPALIKTVRGKGYVLVGAEQ